MKGEGKMGFKVAQIFDIPRAPDYEKLIKGEGLDVQVIKK